MKLHLLVLALFVGAAIQSSTANESSIEGRVLRAGTGEPIPNTPVTLISSAGLTDSALAALLDQISAFITAGLQGQGGGGNQNATIQAVTNLLEKAGPGVGTQGSVLTDRAGRFAFTNLPRGRYTVWVQRFNYYGPLLNGVPTSTVSATVLADPAKPLPPVDLFLTAGLAITGRVLDSRGQPPPAPAWNVTVFRASYADGRLLWSPVLSRAIDDRGEYRLSPLPPGDYYVGVTPPPTALSPAGQDPPVRTFFPGVIEPAQATKLVLKGNDISNVDFSIRTAPSAFFKISGIAINPSSAATPNAAGFVDRTFNTFGLVPAESHLIDSFTSGQFANVVAAANRAAGEFEIRNVRPGNYELYPLPLYFGFPLGKVYVDVRSADAVGVRLASSSLVGLQGKIVVAGQSPQRPVRFDTVQVTLKPWMTPFARAGMPSVPVSPAGDFVVQGPAGARAMLQVTGLPDTAFISDILMGGNSVFSNGFELPAASEQIQVLVDAANGGTVETLVRSVDGRGGSRANVVLVPDEAGRLTPISYKTGITDNDGRLTLRGVPPGSYTAFAWESAPDTAWLNAEFVSKYAEKGTPVRVGTGVNLKLELTWIPFDSDLR